MANLVYNNYNIDQWSLGKGIITVIIVKKE